VVGVGGDEEVEPRWTCGEEQEGDASTDAPGAACAGGWRSNTWRLGSCKEEEEGWCEEEMWWVGGGGKESGEGEKMRR
jgi:hypothetical protein